MSDDRVRVLIAGGGVAGLEAMLALRALAAEVVRTELLAPEPQFWYRPLSVAEPFDAGTAHRFELTRLVGEAGATFTLGELAAVDADRKVARSSTGAELPFDVLVIASGAMPKPVLAQALTFRGPADSERFRALIGELETGSAGQLAFVVHALASWSVPLYELALLTASHLARSQRASELVVVTHEEEPLGMFGKAASEMLQAVLADRGLTLLTSRRVSSFDGDELTLVPGPSLRAERVVTLPRLEGRRIEGVPCDANGFVPVDEFGRVSGLRDVFAAGDITAFPIKQGGIAAQAAEVVAKTIAAEAGAPVVAEPFRPVLRGLLLTGGKSAFMRAEAVGGRGESSTVSSEALWWPPAKIVGRYLAPTLARSLRYAEAAPPADGVAVDVDLSSIDRTAAHES